MFIRLVVLILMLAPSVYAQDEGDDFFEDDGYDEPYDEPEIPRPGAPPRVGSGFRQPPTLPQTPAPSTRQANRSVDAPVEFILVDPPKFWKPKKRKLRHNQGHQ